MSPSDAWSDGAPPRVSLIGPKGCGKTIYRTYLHAKARTELPDYVRAMLGVTQADLPAKGEMRTSQGGVWTWTHEGDLGQREAAGEYLPVIRPTKHVTRHRLALPLVHGEPVEAGLAYDFPGAYWETEEHKPFIIEALRASRLIVMMLPYWILVPHALRQRPSLLARARWQRDGLDAVAIQREQDEREEALRTGTLKWLELVQIARDGTPGRAATLLVVFTMLHREWLHDLGSGSAAASSVAERVRAMRRLITQPVLNCPHQARRGRRRTNLLVSLAAELQLALRGLSEAAALRRALEELHDACDDYVEALEGPARDLGPEEEETLRLIEALRRVESRSLPHAFRYAAMNVVSERYARRRALSPREQRDAQTFGFGSAAEGDAVPAYQRYLRIESAAAMLPSLYLCGSLDDLC
jgi:hypothetical protein